MIIMKEYLVEQMPFSQKKFVMKAADVNNLRKRLILHYSGTSVGFWVSQLNKKGEKTYLGILQMQPHSGESVYWKVKGIAEGTRRVSPKNGKLLE